MPQPSINRQEKKLLQKAVSSPEAIDQLLLQVLPSIKETLVNSTLTSLRKELPTEFPALPNEALVLIQGSFERSFGPRIKEQLLKTELPLRSLDQFPLAVKSAVAKGITTYLQDHFDGEILPELSKGIGEIMRERSPQVAPLSEQHHEAMRQRVLVEEKALISEFFSLATDIKPRSPRV